MNDLLGRRLALQQISAHRFTQPEDIVSWMGAMQAQDYNMARWAVAIRLGDAPGDVIRDSINKGVIIRTHVLRPTWHLIPASDARWMLDLTAPQIRKVLPSRHRNLGITAAIVKKAVKVLERSLEGNNFMTREELVQEFARHKIATHEQRASHLLLCAELEKVICNGPMQGKKNTYALFDERVPQAKALARDEALRKLAGRYFQSHGPATLADFVNWSDLPVADARKALSFIADELTSTEIDSQVYWFKPELELPPAASTRVFLLPAFDEYTIGYKDRSACLSAKNRDKAISINGMFWPIIVVDGMVVGLWKRVVAGKKASVELNFFSKNFLSWNKDLKAELAEAGERVREFFGERSGEAL